MGWENKGRMEIFLYFMVFNEREMDGTLVNSEN